ncbi:unnamed protein product [Hermetia illucens]|uniref:Uncharacterized protein n=1 Tax=Hermetia illucens TaxID=343691 RepID=A0A7R8UUN3_HERIL|nr:pickpocket protein 28-like [Hermetia illucens]CAD7087312.1 unnamed protein product [Hermetia illucens]
MGFTVVLNASLNEYFCSSSRNAGFKILVHGSSEVPRIADSATLVPTKYETRIQINPSYRDTAKNVRSLPIKDRKCLYNSELTLKSFRIYTSGNCRMECTADIMERECGCIQIYLPRRSNDTLICGLSDIRCANQVEREVNNLLNPNGKCNSCPCSCDYIEYKVTVTRSRLLAKDPQLDAILQSGYDVNELAVVHFYHNQRRIRVTRMEAYLGFLNFFSNSGGIYSLFLGFSFLSLIELCYFTVLFLPKAIKYIRTKAQRTVKAAPKCASIYSMNREESIIRRKIGAYFISNADAE